MIGCAPVDGGNGIVRTWASSDDVGQKRIGVVDGKWVTKPSWRFAAVRFDNYTFARQRLRTRACHPIGIKGQAISLASRQEERWERERERTRQGREYVNESVLSSSDRRLRVYKGFITDAFMTFYIIMLVMFFDGTLFPSSQHILSLENLFCQLFNYSWIIYYRFNYLHVGDKTINL